MNNNRFSLSPIKKSFVLLYRSLKWTLLAIFSFVFIMLAVMAIWHLLSPQGKEIIKWRGGNDFFLQATPLNESNFFQINDNYRNKEKHNRTPDQYHPSPWELAFMSADVYGNHKCADQAENLSNIDSKYSHSQLIGTTENVLALESNWKRHTEFDVNNYCSINDTSIKVNAYVRTEKINSKTVIVLAFRGSQPGNRSDWCSNFRYVPASGFFCGFGSFDSYTQIVPYVLGVLSDLQDKYGDDIVFWTTGHSLGGGLAEASRHVIGNLGLVTFNSSPISSTNEMVRIGETLSSPHFMNQIRLDSIARKYFASPDEIFKYCSNQLTEKKWNKLGDLIKPGHFIGQRLSFQFYEHGEILAFLRPFEILLKKLGFFLERHAVGVRTNVLVGNPIEQHDISNYACELKKLYLNYDW